MDTSQSLYNEARMSLSIRMWHEHWKIPLSSILALLITLTLASCGQAGEQPDDQPIVEHLVPSQTLDMPTGAYGSVAWLSDGSIVTTFQPEAARYRSWTSTLWRYDTNDGSLTHLDLPPIEEHICPRRFTTPAPAPEGGLLFKRECTLGSTQVGSSNDLAWLREDGSIESYLPLPREPLFLGPYDVSYDGGLVLATVGGEIAPRLELMTRNGQRQDLFTRFARAGYPQWSPDASHVAFFGDEQMPGNPSHLWVLEPTDLWVAPVFCRDTNAECIGEPTSVVKNVGNHGDLRWSPDGRHLAFAGEFGDSKGLFLYDVASGEIVQVANGRYLRFSWAPDGSRIVALKPYGFTEADYENMTEGELLDLAKPNTLEVFDLSPNRDLSPLPRNPAPPGPIPDLLPNVVIADVRFRTVAPAPGVADSAIELTFVIRNDGPGDFPADSDGPVPLGVFWHQCDEGALACPRHTEIARGNLAPGDEITVTKRLYGSTSSSRFPIVARIVPLLPTAMGSDSPTAYYSNVFTIDAPDISYGNLHLFRHTPSSAWSVAIEVLNLGSRPTTGEIEARVAVPGELLHTETLEFRGTWPIVIPRQSCRWFVMHEQALRSGEPQLDRALATVWMSRPGSEAFPVVEVDPSNNQSGHLSLEPTETSLSPMEIEAAYGGRECTEFSRSDSG